jgi:tRNA-Thr(GGU) m(6)t(6)A37 methyltransferase TsaA
MQEITFHPIGVIHSPFSEPAGVPIQPIGAQAFRGWIELLPEFEAGLQDLEEFSHLILLYCFHKAQGFALEVLPFLDEKPHGVFATRAPRRPNPIGLSIVRLERIEGNRLYFQDVDVVDGTPLLDIKPYVPDFDAHLETRNGWLTGKAGQASQKTADRRFSTSQGE